MPTLDWLRREFHYGYDSGNILSFLPNIVRFREEKVIGGSYRQVFRKAFLPYIKADAHVLELGPGRGSWSRAVLKYIPQGVLHTVDFQDVRLWLVPERYNGRVHCHQVMDNSFSGLPDDYFDFFFSFGVLCHNNANNIRDLLHHALSKMKRGGTAVHQYADWEKLEGYGWGKSNIPEEFKEMSDDQIWWPRNNRTRMTALAQEAGWKVVCPDLDLVKRDAIMVMRRCDGKELECPRS